MLTRSFAIVAYRVAARVGRDRKRKRLVARCGTGGKRRRRRRRSRSLDLSLESLVDSLGKVARTENNERKKRPRVLSLSSTSTTTSTEWSSFRRARARGFRWSTRSNDTRGDNGNRPPREDTCAAREGSCRASSHRPRRPRRLYRPRRRRFPVARFGVPRHDDARRLLTREGAKGRPRRGTGRGEDLFLEAAQEVGPYLSCLLDTPRFARGTQYPLLGSLDNSSASSSSFYLSLPRCLCRSRKSARRLSSAHTHTHARAPVSLSRRLSLSFLLLPFHSSSVVSVSRATLLGAEIPRRSAG